MKAGGGEQTDALIETDWVILLTTILRNVGMLAMNCLSLPLVFAIEVQTGAFLRL